MTIEQVWDNPLMLTDCYNLSHWYLKENQDFEISHITNRTRPMILYGLNEIVRKIFNNKIEESHIIEASEYAEKMGLHFPIDMWMQVVKDFKGRIPVWVQALPDGTWCQKGTPFAKIMNTEKGFGEIVTYFEGVLLQAYFPSGCATRAFLMKKYLERNNLDNSRFHSFGFRSYNSREASYWAGTGWALSLGGTDDFHTKMHVPTAKLSSIPATAHKTIQIFDNEMYAYRFSVDAAYKKGHKIVAIVIDTYDAKRFIEQCMVLIAQMGKERGMKIIFRPDSGDVFEQACLIYKKCIENNLNNVGVIIGDSISFEQAMEMDFNFKQRKIRLDFISYGIGGKFHKDIDRDYLGWAMKTCYANGQDRMKFSEDKFKRSIAGDVNIVMDEETMMVDYTKNGLYRTIYHYSERSSRPEVNIQTWDEIKKIVDVQKENYEPIKLSPLVIEKMNIIKEKYQIGK